MFALLLVGHIFPVSEVHSTEFFTNNNTMHASVLLKDTVGFNLEAMMTELITRWEVEVLVLSVQDKTTLLKVGADSVYVRHNPHPAALAYTEVSDAARYTFYWENGAKEATQFQAMLDIFVLNAAENPFKKNLLLSAVASAVLSTSPSLGVHLSERRLLIKKDFYLSNMAAMTQENLPLNNWILFVLSGYTNQQSIVTMGLSYFGKLEMEMEIIGTEYTLQEHHELMYDLVQYVIENDLMMADGQTLKVSETLTIKFTESDGIAVHGRSLKISH